MIEPVSAAVVEAAEVTEAVAEVSEVAGEASEALPQDVLDTPLESFGQEGGNMLDKGKVLEGKEVVMNEPLKTLSQDVLDTPLEPFGEESKDFNELPNEIESPYSSEVNSYARSQEEVDIYKSADLKEGTVGGRTALLNPEINWNQVNYDSGYTKENAKAFARGELPLGFGDIEMSYKQTRN